MRKDIIIAGEQSTFLKEISPDDVLIISGQELSVESVTNDTEIVLTESFV